MINIDLRTIFLNYFFTDIVCLLVMFMLWRQSRKRFEGISYLVIYYLFQVIGLALIFLRGHVPDFISIDVSNTFVVAGSVVGLIGLEYFLGKRTKQIHNYLLIVAYFCVHIYFTFIKPDLEVRNLNSAIIHMLLSAQFAWLLLKRVPENMRSLTRNVGIVMVLYSLINSVRIVEFFLNQHTTQDYFSAGKFETFVILSYQLLFILLTFTFALMINKRLLNEITTQEEKFSKAFHSVPYAIIVTRLSDGKLIEVNKGFETMTDYTSREAIGKTSSSLNLWKNIVDRQKVTTTLRSNEKVKEMEFEFQKKSGEQFAGLISSEIIHIDNEECLISIINDVTLKKAHELELRNQASQLTELNATKDKFFSIIAHDLKNPFNSIVGLSEVLVLQAEEKNFDGIKKFAESIHQSSLRVMDLLLNLMVWSKSQSQGIRFSPEKFELNLLINEITLLLSNNAEQKSIAIEKEIAENTMIFADKAMTNTILRNLISNAIKFTSSDGKILVSAEKQENGVIIKVRDNGVGISKTELEKLFRIDENHSTPGTQNEQGTGLGLILCKEFVERHGGKIWVESEVGLGSTFYFTIPAESI
ncbi:MAG: ATP-binding protein [Prolixibacteraceae bacterium]